MGTVVLVFLISAMVGVAAYVLISEYVREEFAMMDRRIDDVLESTDDPRPGS